MKTVPVLTSVAGGLVSLLLVASATFAQEPPNLQPNTQPVLTNPDTAGRDAGGITTANDRSEVNWLWLLPLVAIPLVALWVWRDIEPENDYSLRQSRYAVVGRKGGKTRKIAKKLTNRTKRAKKREDIVSHDL